MIAPQVDLFGMGNAMNNKPVQMLNQVGFVNQRRKATLFLMSRRMIPDQFRRPLMYNFGGEFRMALQDNMMKAQRPGYNSYNALMTDAPTAKSAIMPTTMGQQVQLSTFSDMWTYVLVGDNDSGLSPLGTLTSIPSRTLYSGWVVDEPVTKQNMGAGYVPNPYAVFQTTHHTTLTVQQQYTPTGAFNHTETTGDYDYLAPMVQNLQSNGQPLFDLSPSKVANGIVEDPLNPHSFQISDAPIATSAKSIEIPTELNAPAFHLQKVVGGMADMVRHLGNPNQNDLAIGNDIAINVLASTLNPGRNSVLNDINPDVPFTFDELLRRYGDGLEIVVCQQPSDVQYDLVSAQAPSKRNVLASIISSSMPPLLAQFGLAEVAFRFNSSIAAVGGLGSTNGERGVFQLLNIATLYAGSETEIASAWENLQRYMRLTLFPIIKANGGEFDLHLHCSLAGVSLVNLQLLDEIVEGGLLETNNLLGGLNTPIVGGQMELQQNASQLFGAVKDTMAVGTPMDSLYSYNGLSQAIF